MIFGDFVKCKPEVRGRLEHVDGGDLERDGLQFRQKVEVHEVLVTEEASTFPTSVDRRSLDDQLDLRNIRFAVHSLFPFSSTWTSFQLDRTNRKMLIRKTNLGVVPN